MAIHYHTDFIFIKSEIEKLSGADFQKVIDLGDPLLIQYPDTRLALYVLLAKTVVNNIDGFIAGLNTCATINLDANIFNQFQHNRIIRLLSHDMSVENITILKTLMIALKSNHKNINLHSLEHFLEKSEQSVLKKQLPELNHTHHSEPTKNIPELTRIILQQYETNPYSLQAAYYRRALRWGDLVEIPVNNNNLTQIPPPRESTLHHYENNEERFMEPSGQFWLDLHYYSYVDLYENNYTDLANYLLYSVKTLISRLPELPYLYFSDNTPFANNDTQKWLLDLIQKKKLYTNSNAIKKIITPEKIILKKIPGENLYSHIQILQKTRATSIKKKFKQNYVTAKLCVLYKRPDLAILLYESLEQTIQDYHLEEWEPELALTVFEDFYAILKSSEKSDYLQKKIINLNILRGLSL